MVSWFVPSRLGLSFCRLIPVAIKSPSISSDFSSNACMVTTWAATNFPVTESPVKKIHVCVEFFCVKMLIGHDLGTSD